MPSSALIPPQRKSPPLHRGGKIAFGDRGEKILKLSLSARSADSPLYQEGAFYAERDSFDADVDIAAGGMQDARRAGAGARHIDLTADRAGRDGARHGEAPSMSPLAVRMSSAVSSQSANSTSPLLVRTVTDEAPQPDSSTSPLAVSSCIRSGAGMLHFDVTAGRMDAQLALDGGAELDIAAGTAERSTVKGQAVGNLDLAGAGLCPEHPICARREIDAQRIVPRWDVEQLTARRC